MCVLFCMCQVLHTFNYRALNGYHFSSSIRGQYTSLNAVLLINLISSTYVILADVLAQKFLRISIFLLLYGL
jgi:hypothetical protein